MKFLSDGLAESQGENELWEIQLIRSDKEKHSVEKSLNRVPSAYLNINKSYLRVIINQKWYMRSLQVSIKDEFTIKSYWINYLCV